MMEDHSPVKTSNTSPPNSTGKARDDRSFSFRKSMSDLSLSVSGPVIGICDDDSSSSDRLTLASPSRNGSSTPDPSFVWTWGSGKYGRLGHGDKEDVSVPHPVIALGGHQIQSVSCGPFVSAFVVDGGQLWMSGKDIDGLFARSSSREEGEDHLSPIALDAFSKISVMSVAVGERICAAISEFGDLFWWGGSHGSSPRSFSSSNGATHRSPPRMTTISCGRAHALALSAEGDVFSWGDNEARQLGHPSTVGEHVAVPTLVGSFPSPQRIKSVSCGYASSAVLSVDGDVFAFGNIAGQREMSLVAPLQQLKQGGRHTLYQVYCNDLYIACTTLLGEAFIYHMSSLPFLDASPEKVTQIFPELSIRELACGSEFVSCLTDSGEVHSWGRSSLSLGLGEVRAKKYVVGPRMIGTFSAHFVRSLSCGTSHVAALVSPQQSREMLAWELLETERIYLRSLAIILHVHRAQEKPRSAVGKLFTEIESMFKLHSEILVEMVQKMSKWNDNVAFGGLFQRIATKKNIDMYTRFHRLHSEWSRQSTSSTFLQGSPKKLQLSVEASDKAIGMRKTGSPYERKKPSHLVGLLSEPFDRIRQYFWLCSRLLAVTPEWHPDTKDLASASEAFHRELSGYYSEVEMMRMTIGRLEGDKEELLKKLRILSATNDNLYLSRNNHEMQKRDLTDLMEKHEHKMRTLNREMEQLRERILQVFLEKRREVIRRRRADHSAQVAVEEAKVYKEEIKRLEMELSVARSLKLYRDVCELREALSERDKEIFNLKEQVQKTKEAEIKQAYTDAHVKNLERENERLTSHLETVRDDLVMAIKKRYAPDVLEDLNSENNNNNNNSSNNSNADKKKALLGADGSVRGATVKGLIHLLVSMEGKEALAAYMKAFFLTYRTFTTPLNVCYEFQRMYCKTPKSVDPPTYWSRILGVLRFWITEHSSDFSSSAPMQTLLTSFLEETVCVTLSPAAAEAIMKDFSRQIASDERSLREHQEVRNSLMAESKMMASVCSVDTSALCLAMVEQLVMIEWELFCGLEARELLGCQWLRKPASLVKSPTVVSVTDRFNRVCHWVVTEILSRSDVKDRRDGLSAVISMASRARQMGAFNTTMELVAGLNSGSVQRLKKSWEMLGKKDRQCFEELEEAVSSRGSFRNMREMMRERREKKLPCLPYLGLYLSDLVFMDEGSMSELSPGVINFAKLTGISATISEVLDYKLVPFSFPINGKIRNYLISCSVLSEDDAWDISYKLEPREPEA